MALGLAEHANPAIAAIARNLVQARADRARRGEDKYGEGRAGVIISREQDLCTEKRENPAWSRTL